MAERTIRTGIGTYLRAGDGQWSFGSLGDVVDVHKDDLERFDRLNPEAPAAVDADGDDGDVVEAPFPEGDPHEEWKIDELKAYAAAREIDLGSASKKADILAALAAGEQEA